MQIRVFVDETLQHETDSRHFAYSSQHVEIMRNGNELEIRIYPTTKDPWRQKNNKKIQFAKESIAQERVDFSGATV